MENKDPLNDVNAHVLNAILDAGQERTVLALRDIFDERGVKLLAQNMQLTHGLQQRLLERRLRQPLESSLRFESGLDKVQLRQLFAKVAQSGDALSVLVLPWATKVEEQVTSLPLDPALLFLLTTMQSTTPPAFEHAVRAMALAGAMSARSGAGPGDLRQAMMAGLVHDIGELHLDPGLYGLERELDLPRFRQLVTHARLGEQLITGLKQYPLAVSRAVGEHHERLDGSGYPLGRTSEALSPLGRMLAVVETTLGVLDAPDVPLARASFALRVVPGEYEGLWVGMVTSAAEREPASAWGGETMCERAWAGLELASRKMSRATAQAQVLSGSPHPVVRTVALRAAHLLERLRTGWNEMGLWMGAPKHGSSSREVPMADEELRYRLSVMERDCLVLQDELDESDTQELAPLWQCLTE